MCDRLGLYLDGLKKLSTQNAAPAKPEVQKQEMGIERLNAKILPHRQKNISRKKAFA